MPLILSAIVLGSLGLLALTTLLLVICFRSEQTKLPGVSEAPVYQPVEPLPESKSPLPSPPPTLRPVIGWVKSDPPESAADQKAGNSPPVAAKAAIPQEGVDKVKLDQAVARGVAYLKRGAFRQQVPGSKALAGLTLLSCGTLDNDPAVQHVAEVVRSAAASLATTYDLALCILFLDRLGDAGDSGLIRTMAMRLIAGQGVRGGWDYTCMPLSRGDEKELESLLRKGSAKPPRLGIRASGSKAGGRGRPAPVASRDVSRLPVLEFQPGQTLTRRPGPREDNSLTQFAVLALWAAQKYGVPAGRSLAMAEARFRASQNPDDGSWSYQWRDLERCKYSMTCAGLLGLAAGRGSDPSGPKEPKSAVDPAIDKALRFVSQEIGLDPAFLAIAAGGPAAVIQTGVERWLKSKVGFYNDTKSGWGALYFLWSLERVAVVYDLRTIGGKDWYAWGAPIILDTQQPDGSWKDTFPGVPDTCFALLFLKRTNVVQDLTQRIQFLTVSKEVGVRMGESEPASDQGFGRRSELQGDISPGRARSVRDE